MQYINRIISIRKSLILSLLLACTACQTDNTSIQAYRYIGAHLGKKFHLTRTDLIVAYDLVEIDGSDCIYSKELGAIINNKDYQDKYLLRFDKNFRSAVHLRFVASKKILKISNLLQKLHKKYKVLSNNEYHYLRRLSMQDIRLLDSRRELKKIDEIAKYIPILLPECGAKISSHYGKRHHPIHGKHRFHPGIDMYSNKACAVFASASGVVTFVGKKNGYGNVVEISHKAVRLTKKRDEGVGVITTRYAHLNSYTVKTGQGIHRGEAIGRQGSSGNVTNEHLHFEILVNGQPVNPYDFISNDCSCRKH